MSTLERLAELRHQHPIYFRVWSRCVALAALIGWPTAADLNRLVRQSADPAATRLRSTLDDLRAYVANFRAEHDPQCACEWDSGAMWAIEAVDATLTPSKETP